MNRPQSRETIETLAWALAYLAHGFSVIPIEARGKRPLIPWQAFQQKPPDPEIVRRWFRGAPQANVAIVTGQLSGIIVLDIDPSHGGRESLSVLEQTSGPLPATVEALTGGEAATSTLSIPGLP
nr:bifunctional DNA primase/polymerase [Methylacidimicrobium cyclopophantes]